MKKLALALLISSAGFFEPLGASEVGIREGTLSGGWVLPDQVEGMDEILSTWGVQLGVGLVPSGSLVGGYWSAKDQGVSAHHLDFGWRYSSTLDGVMGYFLGGLSLTQYSSPLFESDRQDLGVLLAPGFMFQLSQEIWISSEMRFRLEPGVQLLFLVGLSLRLPPG